MVIQSIDADGDPIIYSYQWIKNEMEISGRDKNTLKSENFRRGDVIQAKVTPSDGKVEGKPVLSAPVKILNSPPMIREVWIEPKIASVREDLRVHVQGVDPDNDFLYYTYQWEINGVVINEEKREVLEKSRIKKGDLIAVMVTPDDREAKGMPKKSDPVTISNSPPLIVSTPPTTVERGIYLYQVKTVDPDNEPILYTLKKGPKRMEINKDTGLIRWEIQKEDRGIHSIEIEASDSEGAKSVERYTLTVELK